MVDGAASNAELAENADVFDSDDTTNSAGKVDGGENASTDSPGSGTESSVEEDSADDTSADDTSVEDDSEDDYSKDNTDATFRGGKAPRTIYLGQSTRPDKKYMVKLGRGLPWIHFGQKGASDYTIHHDLSRKENYVRRHRDRENWSRTGVNTSGFWARWLLWNKPSKREAIRYIEQKLHVRVRNFSVMNP